MKSITFLRKTWKKLAAGHRDDEQPQESAPMNALQPNSSHSLSRNYDDRPILRRNTSRFALDIACRTQGSPTTSQPPIRDCNQLARLSSQLPYSSTDAIDHSQSQKYVENSVPYQESLPVYQNLRPLHVSDNLGSISRCPYKATNYTRSTDALLSTTPSDEVLDLLVDAKPHTLYHGTRSMPYLPYEDETKYTQAPSVSSVDASEGNFPLFLFPTPPPLIARKRIPPPLVLRNSPSTASPQSSPDSTPVGTPMTPRFSSPHSLSQSSFGSCKRFHSGRRVTLISPPPFSPPNSPLPSPPVCHEDNGCPLNYAGRPLRTAYSSSNIKDALPFPATHRLTFSEPISDQSSLPIKKSRKPRPEAMQAERLQACLEAREQGSLTAVENNVQWGYAL
ncbi:hypothetical protein BYT27DRAFT_7251875 [Phlegmacium glaucopus]|nr:hypothetical protein BYT27DRAFT_7251875 [Phlegmacium glaucopus]